MSEENATVHETNGATNGASNGMSNGDLKPAEAAVSVQHREDETAPHKRKARGRRDKTAAATPVVTPPVEEPATASAPVPQEPVEEATAVSQEPVAAPPQENAETPQDARGDAGASSPSQEPTHPAPAEENLRLRMKVWTDHWTGKRYLMSVAFMRDIKNGQPTSDVMLAYAMRDDDTRIVTLRAEEWNTLPFFYFHEDGPAPRASARPADSLGSHSPRVGSGG